MEFTLKFPDKIFNEDAVNYKKFIGAFQLMLNRMAMSHEKYQSGLPMDQVVKNVDELAGANQRIAMYDSKHATVETLQSLEDLHKPANTGNTENLLDGANMLLIEFTHPKHPKAKFKAQTTEQSPGLVPLEEL